MEIYYNCSYTGSPVGFITGKLQYSAGQRENYALCQEEIPMLIQRCFDLGVVRKAWGKWSLTSGSAPVYFLLIKGLEVNEGKDERGIDLLSEYYLNFALVTDDRGVYKKWLQVNDRSEKIAQAMQMVLGETDAITEAIALAAGQAENSAKDAAAKEVETVIREKISAVLEKELPAEMAEATANLMGNAAAEEIAAKVTELGPAGRESDAIRGTVQKRLAKAAEKTLQTEIAEVVKETMEKDRASDFGFTVKASELKRLTECSFGILLPEGPSVNGADLDEKQISFELRSADPNSQQLGEVLGLAYKEQRQDYLFEPLESSDGWFCYRKKKITPNSRESHSGIAASPASGHTGGIRSGRSPISSTIHAAGDIHNACPDDERIEQSGKMAAKVLEATEKGLQRGGLIYKDILEPGGKKLYKKVLKPGGKKLRDAAECGIEKIMRQIAEAGQQQDYRKKPGGSAHDKLR